MCKNCHDRADGDFVKVTDKILKLMDFIIRADYKTVFAYGGADSDVTLMAEIAEKYMINELEIFPGSLTYLKNIIYGGK